MKAGKQIMSAGSSLWKGLTSRVAADPRAPLGLIAGRLWLMMALAVTATARGADTPVTPNASPEAQSLLAFLSDIYGKSILSGQQAGWRGTNELGFEMRYIERTTGKLPAVLGQDLGGYTRIGNWPGRSQDHAVANHAIDWYNRRKGIVTLCWHWYAPMGHKAFYTKDAHFDLERGLIEGTPEHAAIFRDVDAIAVELKLLRDAHVPVLWRPLHEANGRWFWWGAQGPEPFKKLWRLMFDRLAFHHQLTNLVWVFSPGAAIDLADWYPGDQYVDIIGQDHYPMDGNNGPAKEEFDELVAFGRGTKLVGLSENGPIPDPDRLVREKAGWLFFVTWAGNMLTQRNSKLQLKSIYNNPYVLNLGNLPDLKHYRFESAGKAVELGFPAPPGNVAVCGWRRQPVTVAVQDENGRTVRTGSYTVTLTLGKDPGEGMLAGTLTASTVNGIAVFPGLKIDTAGRGYTLVASSAGLRRATSESFQVGPGAGILWEWWSGMKMPPLAGVSGNKDKPAGREILGDAFEVPYHLVTNYSARFQGWLLPPLTGSYVFWIDNENVSELWLSTDASPAHKVRIAAVTGATPYVKWPHTHEAKSNPVHLAAGRRYYLEALQQQPSGSAHLSVRWRRPDGVEQRPIPAAWIAPFVTDESESKVTETTTRN